MLYYLSWGTPSRFKTNKGYFSVPMNNERYNYVGQFPPQINAALKRHMDERISTSDEATLSHPYITPGCKFGDPAIIVACDPYQKAIYFSSIFIQHTFDLANREHEGLINSRQYWIDRCDNVQSEVNINKTVIEGLTKQLKENNEKIEMLSAALALSKEKESKLLKRLHKCQNK